jgi:5-methylcytosine-specific restriction enzyme subunit McrC
MTYQIPIRNLWHMLLYAWNELPDIKNSALGDAEDAPTFDALLKLMLAKLIRQRLRIGLGRDYINESGLIKSIRGRINFNQSLKRDSFHQGSAYCEYQTYHINVPKNQFIRSTLHQLGLHDLFKALEGIDLIELNPDLIRREHLKCKDKDYRVMLGICELILRNQMPTDFAGDYLQPVIERDALMYHSIYERFVANFYRFNLKGWLVTAQKHLQWHETFSNNFLPMMKPDLMLEEKTSGKILIIDTKFTAKSLIENQWNKEKFDSSHLYQLYAYLKTQEHLSEKHRQAIGILLYPTVHGKNLSEVVQLQDMSLRVESVDLSLEWREIEKRLIEIIK